jgi:peptide/nickel transport system permease protein
MDRPVLPFGPAGAMEHLADTLPGTPGGPPPAPGQDREFTVAATTQWRIVVRRFVHHKLAMTSLVVFVFIVLAAMLGPRIWHYSATEGSSDLSQPPSWDHPFGTDGLGHDGLAMVMQGAQKSIQITLLVAVFSTIIGTVIGAVAGYFRGWTDGVLMRFTDLILTIPLIALTAVLAGRFQSLFGGWVGIAVVLIVFGWTTIARIVRAEILSLREKEFVEAARAVGASDRRIIARHILPNVAGVIIVAATIAMATALLAETALSFLGLGIKVPDTSLGLQVAQGQTAFQTRPWLFYFPGLVIILIVLTVNFIGDGLRDAFDPKQTRVRA